MDQFTEVKKKLSMAEATRVILNKSIDLLHKLSKKKISSEFAKKEFSTLISSHILSMGDNDGMVLSDQKIKLEYSLQQTYEIVDKIESGKAPLYEAIMLMSRVLSDGQQKEEEKKIAPIRLTPIEQQSENAELVSQEFDHIREDLYHDSKVSQKETSPKVTDSEKSPTALMEEVIAQKKRLESAISDLNHSLQSIGFELKPINK